MADVVTLKHCANSFEAQVIKARLESEGIPSMITSENISVIYGSAVGALNPRVLVNEADLERAKAAIDCMNNAG